MKDLTKGSIEGHVLSMAVPTAMSMFAQIAYQFVDLYFISRIGVAETAGVNAAGGSVFALVAAVQIIGVGTLALVAHAVGQKNQSGANQLTNQSLILSLICALVAMVILYGSAPLYMSMVAADAATIEAGVTFIYWVLPGCVLVLPMTVLGSALRGMGLVAPAIVAHGLTVLVNVALAPILISGWGFGLAMGVKGAGLATSVSVALGLVLLGMYFHRKQRYLTLNWAMMKPRYDQWRRIIAIGAPSGVELAMIFLSPAVVYYVIRDLGAAAQAGYGIGTRLLQVLLLPGMSIALALAPIAGQSFGARNSMRVKESFWKVMLIGTTVMFACTMVVQLCSSRLLLLFDASVSSMAIADGFLRMMSWAFVSQGLVYTCSSLFQGLGNTMPSLISCFIQFLVFSMGAIWLSGEPAFRIELIWYLAVVVVTLQAALSLWLVRVEFRRRLPI